MIDPFAPCRRAREVCLCEGRPFMIFVMRATKTYLAGPSPTVTVGARNHTKHRNDRLSNHVTAALVPAISTRIELAKDALPVSKQPMEMARSSPAARAVRQHQGRLVSVGNFGDWSCRAR